MPPKPTQIAHRGMKRPQSQQNGRTENESRQPKEGHVVIDLTSDSDGDGKMRSSPQRHRQTTEKSSSAKRQKFAHHPGPDIKAEFESDEDVSMVEHPVERPDLEALLAGRDQSALKVEIEAVYERSGPSKAFDKYTDETFEREDMSMHERCLRCALLLHLVDKYGVGEAWEHAIPMSDYFEKNLPIDEPWPGVKQLPPATNGSAKTGADFNAGDAGHNLVAESPEKSEAEGMDKKRKNLQNRRSFNTYEEFENAWISLGRYLEDSEELKDKELSLFFEHMDTIMSIAESHNILTNTPDWPLQMSGWELKQYEIPKVIAASKMVLFDREWEEAIEGAENDANPLGKSALQEARVKMHAEFGSLESRPYGPDKYEWALGWDELRAKFEAAKPPRHTLFRLKDQHELVKKCWKEHEELIFPPKWPKGVSIHAFAESLPAHVQHKRKHYLTERYQAAMKNVPSEEEEEQLRNDFSRVMKALKKGDPVWLPNRWPRSAQPNLKERARELGFDATRPGLTTGTWNFRAGLGAGQGAGQSQVGLWVQYNRNGTVINRMVVKEVYMGGLWDVDMYWEGPNEERFPVEESIGRLLTACEGSENIVELLGCGLYEPSKMYRLYMEYCAHGNLEDLIEAHAGLRDAIQETRGRSEKDEGGEVLVPRISVRMMWSIFEAFAAAACLMRYGHLPDKPAPAGGHDPIIHRDLKPINVFLSTPNPPSDPTLPTTKIGDFGISGRMSSPSAEWPGGTPGYQAPEQIAKQPPSPATDIWVLGRMMLSLMNLQGHMKVMGLGQRRTEFLLDEKAAAFYPEAMVDVVRECMMKKPRERIEADQLWAMVRGMAGKWEASEEGEGDGDVVLYREDKYLKWGVQED